MYGLKEEHINTIQSIFEKYLEIDEAILYGSRAKGNYRNGSDIDLTLKGEKLNLSVLSQIQIELEDTYLPYQVDLSIYHTIENPKLIEHIDRVGISFYKNKTMNEWREVKLKDISINKKGNYGIPASAVEYCEDKYTYLRISDINDDGSLNKANLKSVEDKRASNYLLAPNDIVFARTGNSTGRSYFYNKKDGELVYAGFLIKFSLDDTKVNPKILKYYTHSQSYYDWVKSVDNGATRGNINAQTYGEMEICLPPRLIQDTIVSILSSLDDKIDVLHRQNETLEQMAETLFRQWFVEEADDSWEEKPLSSIATFLNGLACQKYPPKNNIEKLPVLKIKELRNGLSDDSDWVTTEVSPEYIIENGDVIFSWSASLMVKIWDGKKCILNQHLFKVTSEQYPKWYYYLWCKFHLEQFIAIARAHATTMGHIKRKDLDEAMVLVPTENELTSMGNHINPLMEKIILNNKQLSNLTAIRDTLLPKLMSGEVRVK